MTKRATLWMCLGLTVYAAVVFRAVWPAGVTLHAQDHNIALMAQYRAELPGGLFTGFWRAGPFLGRMGVHPMHSTFLLLSVLPLELFFDWIYPAYLLAGSFFLMSFLRQRGLSPLPSLAGALTAFWTGSNLTLAHPGHLDKFAVLCFAAATLYGTEKLFNTRSIRWGLFTGGCLGMMAMHQGDVALFFALPLGAWFLFRFLQDTRSPALPNPAETPQPRPGRPLVLLLAGLLAPLVLTGVEAFRFAQEAHVRGVAVLEEGDPQERWEFATQWSWPPREALGLIAPGFHGHWTGHPSLPYTGVTGRSPEWDRAGEGFANLKLESPYLGLLPFALAVLALVQAPRSGERRFWAAALVVSLLLAAGKFTPVYGLFYRLPLIGSIRNPNKFLQVFQLVLGILCAFGAQSLLASSSSLRRRFALGLGSTALLLGVGGLLVQTDDPLQLRPWLETPWAEYASDLLRLRQTSLLHAAAFGLTASLGIRYMRPKLLWVFPAMLALDGALSARHFLEPFPTDFMRENPVAEFLKERIGFNRVATLETEGLYAHLLHYVFPCHGIPAANLMTAPRLGSDVQRYLETAGPDTLRLWRDLGVTHVLMSGALWDQVQRLSEYRAALDPVMTYSIDGETHHVLEFVQSPGRFQFRNAALESVAAHRRGFVLEIEAGEAGGRLRLADRHTPRLAARLNGTPVAVEQEEGLFPVIDLPPGRHTLEIAFHPGSFSLRAQQTGVGLWLCSLLWLPFGGRSAASGKDDKNQSVKARRTGD